MFAERSNSRVHSWDSMLITDLDFRSPPFLRPGGWIRSCPNVAGGGSFYASRGLKRDVAAPRQSAGVTLKQPTFWRNVATFKGLTLGRAKYKTARSIAMNSKR